MSADCESHSVQRIVGGVSNNKAVVHIKVVGSQEPLLITCTSIETAENIADLVDRYCRLVNGTNLSLWNKRGKFFFIIRSHLDTLELLIKPSWYVNLSQASQMTYYGCPCHHGNILSF